MNLWTVWPGSEKNGTRQKPQWRLLINIKTQALCCQRICVFLTRPNKRRIPTLNGNHSVSKDFCTKCPQRMKTGIWLQVIFTPSFYCGPLVFWIGFYYWSKEGMCGCCTVLPFSLKPTREVGSYRGASIKPIFIWKSTPPSFATN